MFSSPTEGCSIPESKEMLIQRCGRGDRYAFDLLWEPYRPEIFHFLFHHIGDREEAPDLTQETSLCAWLSLYQGIRVRSPRPWVHRIAHNLALDWHDQNRRAIVSIPWDDQPFGSDGRVGS